MKTFGKYHQESIGASQRLDEQGFKNTDMGKKKKKKKKSLYLSDRERKLRDLRARPQSWSGLK